MKKRLSITYLCLLPLSAATCLFYSLEIYYRYVHNESGFLVCAYCLIAFFISLVLWKKNKAAGKYVTCIFSFLWPYWPAFTTSEPKFPSVSSMIR